MNRVLRALAALGAALVFAGCGGVPDASELESDCVDGDNDACDAIGVPHPDWSPGNMEPAAHAANQSPPQPFLGGGQQLSATVGQAHQGFLSTEVWGWSTGTTGAPGFLDPFATPELGFTPVGLCGVTSDTRTCLFPKGPDLKLIWTWSWRRGFRGSTDPSCGNLNANDDYLFGIRDAMAMWSQGTGISMVEVPNGQEDITIFCDDMVVARMDPTQQFGASWGPYGLTNGPQADNIHDETAECDGNGLSLDVFGGGKAYVYSGAGIVLNPRMFTDRSLSRSWARCPGYNTHPSPLRSIGKIVTLHEMAHHFGFQHFESTLPSMNWMRPAVSCATALEQEPFPAAIPQQFKDTVRLFRSRRQVELAGFPAGQGFQQDRGLYCFDPDFSIPIENQ